LEVALVDDYAWENAMTPQEIRDRWLRPDVAAKIYRLDEELGAPPNLNRLIEGVGIMPPPAEAWEEIGLVLQFEQPPHEFTVYRPSRAIRYVDANRWQIDNGGSTLNLSDDEAIRAALEAVEQLGLFGDDKFVPTKVTRLNVSITEKGSDQIDQRIIDAGIVFSRNLDDLTVIGPGGKVVVYLDPDIRLTGFEGWREPDDVLGEIQSYWNTPLDTDLVTIEDLQIGYLELGRLQRQTIMQPVYVLTLRLANQENGAVRHIEHFVHAAKNGIGPLMPQHDIVTTVQSRNE
jgi:hypothetical protein